MMKLCKFCGSEPRHKKPIWDYYSGKTYVTNGYYILRISGQINGAAEAKVEHQQMLTFVESLFPTANELAAMRHVPYPVDGGTVTRCETCRGRGITKKCDECDGSGEVSFENDYHTYECECQSCDGDGIRWAIWVDEGATRCLHCQGTGKEVDESKPVRIGKARLNPHYMHILSQLPLIAWAAHGIHGHFVFMGGDGVLIGRKTPQEDY